MGSQCEWFAHDNVYKNDALDKHMWFSLVFIDFPSVTLGALDRILCKLGEHRMTMRWPWGSSPEGLILREEKQDMRTSENDVDGASYCTRLKRQFWMETMMINTWMDWGFKNLGPKHASSFSMRPCDRFARLLQLWAVISCAFFWFQLLSAPLLAFRPFHARSGESAEKALVAKKLSCNEIQPGWRWEWELW